MPDRPAVAAAALAGTTPMSSLRTYIIEDSPVIRQNLAATLEELAPITVVGGAETQAEAVKQLEDGASCDLVIVDVVLKEGSGLGVLQHPGVHKPGRHFVVLTNYATTEIRQRALRLGALRVFDKSNDIDALIDYCRELAAQSPSPA